MRIGVTGHQQLPIEALEHVRTEISAVFSRAGKGLVGLTSLAEGTDQLFAIMLLMHGGRMHAVIPCERYEDAFANPSALLTYRALLAAASEVETLSFTAPSQQAFLEAGQRVVDLADALIAVWDGQPARGPGGTADIVRYARERGVPVTIAWPAGVARS
jgi:hypothetical protein